MIHVNASTSKYASYQLYQLHQLAICQCLLPPKSPLELLLILNRCICLSLTMLLSKFVPAWICLLRTVSAVWPLPMQYSNGSKVLWLSSDFQTVYEPLPSIKAWDNFQKYLLCVVCTLIQSSAMLIAYVDPGGIPILLLYMISPL